MHEDRHTRTVDEAAHFEQMRDPEWERPAHLCDPEPYEDYDPDPSHPALHEEDEL